MESERQKPSFNKKDAGQHSIEKDLWPEWLRVSPDLHPKNIPRK